MTEFFLTAHIWWQYVVLIAVIVAAALAFRIGMMSSTAETVYRITAVVVDIQVGLGVIIWINNSGWSLGFLQGWLHPILGLAAAGALHAFISRARKANPESANRLARIGLIVAFLLVVASVGIAEAV